MIFNQLVVRNCVSFCYKPPSDLYATINQYVKHESESLGMHLYNVHFINLLFFRFDMLDIYNNIIT